MSTLRKYFVRHGDMDNQIPASCGIILCWCIYPQRIWLSDISLDILVFHVCRDRCSPGLAPISGGFNVKIITVMPIQDKDSSPPSLIILKLTRHWLIRTGSRGILPVIIGGYYVHSGHRGAQRNRDKLSNESDDDRSLMTTSIISLLLPPRRW